MTLNGMSTIVQPLYLPLVQMAQLCTFIRLIVVQVSAEKGLLKFPMNCIGY